MLIILEIIDIFFFIRREALHRDSLQGGGDQRHLYPRNQRHLYPDGCSESLFYLQLSHILNFQTLLLMGNTSSVT